jgi:hypothetical protein
MKKIEEINFIDWISIWLSHGIRELAQAALWPDYAKFGQWTKYHIFQQNKD